VGNWPGRSLVTKAALGGRAIQRAVTRVKFEQASKESMQTPTRLLLGKAARAGKQSTHAPVRSAGVLDTARWNGDAGNRGRPVQTGGRGFNIAHGGGSGGSRTGSYDRRGWVIPAEERTLTSGVLSKLAR
jgi:hypothetical protein